jgi:hypothetical protein
LSEPQRFKRWTTHSCSPRLASVHRVIGEQRGSQDMQDEPEQRVTIERGGKTYTGTYKVDHRIITVKYESKTETTQVGNLPPHVLARQLLGELITKSKRRA